MPYCSRVTSLTARSTAKWPEIVAGCSLSTSAISTTQILPPCLLSNSMIRRRILFLKTRNLLPWVVASSFERSDLKLLIGSPFLVNWRSCFSSMCFLSFETQAHFHARLYQCQRQQAQNRRGLKSFQPFEAASLAVRLYK